MCVSIFSLRYSRLCGILCPSMNNTVIFDLDGTLTDTEILKEKAFKRTITEYGGSAPDNAYGSVIGSSWAQSRAFFISSGGVDITDAQFDDSFIKHYLDLLRTDLTFFPGAKDLIDRLVAEGQQAGIVTGSPGWMMEHVRAGLDLDKTFKCIISADDVTRQKPHPEGYLRAVEEMNADPTQTVVFEDSLAGLTAAMDADLPVIAMRHPFNAQQDFSEAIATFNTFEGNIDEIMQVIADTQCPDV